MTAGAALTAKPCRRVLGPKVQTPTVPSVLDGVKDPRRAERRVVQYEDTNRLAYVRGPEGIIVGLSQQLKEFAGKQP